MQKPKIKITVTWLASINDKLVGSHKFDTIVDAPHPLKHKCGILTSVFKQYEVKVVQEDK